jgi:hypothetical protein
VKYRCISADSHLEVKPEVYTCRVPIKYRDHTPRTIRLHNGALAVLQEGRRLEWLMPDISCGLSYKERRPFDPAPEDDYEHMPGTGSPERRIRTRHRWCRRSTDDADVS